MLMKWFFIALAFLLAASSADARFPPRGSGGAAPPSHSIAFTALANGTAGGSPIAGSGTYAGTAPSSLSSATWGGGCSGSSTPASFSASSGTWSATFTVPVSSGFGCTIAIADNLGDSATSPGVTITGVSNSITLSCPGTASTSATLACSGTYAGTAPTTTGWTYTLNTTCSGSGTPTVIGIGGGNITSISVPTPGSGCTGTLSVTDNLGSSATSGSVVISAPGPLSLLAVEDGVVYAVLVSPTNTNYTIGGVGKFSGAAPSSMTATISGCGGGSLTTSALVTPSYGPGTYQIQFSMPLAAGTGCVITVTDNLSRTAIGPPIKVRPTAQGANINANVHNAPGWIASHGYTPASGPKTRALNGAGWTPGSPGHFNPGSDLKAYELTSGSCTSASSGGPTGTGGSISDGTCTWKYLSGVDYITITGWALDAPLWQSGKTYTWFETMTVQDGNTLRVYQHDGANHNAFCTSTVAPTGTGTGSGNWGMGVQTTADGCSWNWMGDVTYSSQVASIPTLTYLNAAADVLAASGEPTATIHLDRPYTALLWNDAEYVSGSGGERNPLGLISHGANMACTECAAQGGTISYMTMTPAPGEGFASSLNTSTPLVGYDATKGVAIRNSNAGATFGAGATLNAGPAGIMNYELFTVVNGLQIKSTQGPAFFGFNNGYLNNNIIDGGFNNGGLNNAYCVAIWVDIENVVVNNLVLSHGCAAIGVKYGNTFVNWNTFVNVGSVSNTTAMIFGWSWLYQDIVFSDNAVSGYSHVAAGGFISPVNSSSVGNVTDIAAPDNSGTTWWIDQTANGRAVVAAPGTTFSVSPSTMFISPGSDYRPNTGLSTSGSAVGAFYTNCKIPPYDGGCAPVLETWDTPDILGNTRPNGSGQRSTGAEQHP